MPPSQASAAKNQIAFDFMSEGQVFDQAAGAAEHIQEAESGPGIVPLVSVVAAAGTVVLALVAGGAAEPLMLTILSSLAMLGVFLIFAMAAGHIRIGDRMQHSDIVVSLFEDFDTGIIVTKRDGTILYTNAASEEITGRSPSGDVLPLEQAFAGEAAATEALFRLSRAAERSQPWREEFSVRRPAGDGNRLLRVSCRPLTIAGQERDVGPMTAWSVADVTEERALETRTMESIQATLSHYDSAPAGLVFVGPDGGIRHANTTFLRWLAIDPNVSLSRSLRLADFLPVDGAELLAAAARHPGFEPEPVDLDVLADNGRKIPMRLVARRTGDGGLIVAALNRDVGQGSEIANAEVRFARFFQSAPFGIASVSPEGRIVSANTAFARMVFSEDSGISDMAADVLSRRADGNTRGQIEGALKQVLAGRASPPPVEITAGENKEFSRRVYMSSLGPGRGAREAAVLYVLDATEQKALEAKFAQSSKMEAVGKLAGGIAHDFNNVLTAIIGFSDLLLQTHRASDPAFKDIMNIRSSATRAAGLVAKLLAFSRRQTLQTEPLQLGEVLTDLAPLLKRSIGEMIELKVPTARDLWYVKADKIQFDQVVINLAVNAKDAMPNGGTLTIRTSNVTERESQKLRGTGMPVGEYVLVEVKDTGSGMSPEVLSKVFEPFFTTKGVGKGTGLGLATVYGIVKQSGGFIYADSELGKGTTFRVYLPRFEPEGDDDLIAQREKKKDRDADLTGTGRVLLVEDEDVVRSFAVRALKRQGYEVLEASSGVEALDVMAKNEGQIDLVVSDVVMPEMDGPTMLKELRKTNKELKIIFVSGYPHEAFETSLDKDETFAFLPKPFSLPQLAAKVKEQLGK